MPPPRARAANDDARFEAKERNTAYNIPATKSRKNGTHLAPTSNPNGKDSASAASGSLGPPAAAPIGVQPGSTGINWSSEDVSLLHNYRAAYRLETPPAFKEPITAAILTAPGIGKHSPTMARKMDRRKVGKEHLALAVRKHFNALAVTESDVVVDFLYKVKCQDQSFKMRFAPQKQK